MIQHDPRLLERLDALPKQRFDGDTFRATRPQLDAPGLRRTDRTVGALALDNLMLFTERLADDAAIAVVSSETVDWLAWTVDSRFGC